MYYTVTLADHGTQVKSEPFTVKVTRKCDSLISLTPPVLANDKFIYTITEEELHFELDSFTTDPPYCQLTETVQISPSLPI